MNLFAMDTFRNGLRFEFMTKIKKYTPALKGDF